MDCDPAGDIEFKNVTFSYDGQTEVLLTMLNAGQNYYAAVDSFGEGGVTEGECLPLQ